MTKHESLSKVSKDLMLRSPFYGFFLLMLYKEWVKSQSIPTATVGKNGIGFKLYLNEEFWINLPEKHKQGLLQHELMHIALEHLVFFKHMTNHKIANIAMDLEINQYIEPDYLPTGGQVLSLYPELKLLPKQGSNYYYNELLKAEKDKSSPALNAQLKAQGGITITVSIPGQGNVDIRIDEHGTWAELEGLSEAEQKLIQKQVEHILTEVADQVVKSRGTIPGEFAEIIKRLQNPEPPKFDWRGYLRSFIGGSNKVHTRKTRRKESKRFSGNPALKIKRRRRVLIGIDTSGSVSTSELKEFTGELIHVSKTGTDVVIAQCDSNLSKVHKFDPKEDITIYGRGGTDFTPVVDYFNEHKDDFACLIYFTDGECCAPRNKPQGRMLWVLSSKSKINGALPGAQVKLN